MSDGPHDHAHPDVSSHRAVLATARAVLTADPEAAHDYAVAGSCGPCTVLAAVQLGFTLVSVHAGESFGVSEPLRLWLLAAVDEIQARLDTESN